MMKVAFIKPTIPTEGTIIVGVLEGCVLTSEAADIDLRTSGALRNAMQVSAFEGQKEQTLTLLVPHGLGSVTRLILIGLGKVEMLDKYTMDVFGGIAIGQLLETQDTTATVIVNSISGSPLTEEETAVHIAFGACLRAYHFSKYYTQVQHYLHLKELYITTRDAIGTHRIFYPLAKIVESVFIARTLISEPANVIYPESFANEVRKFTEYGLDVDILSEKQIQALGMNALLAVGQGSVRASQLVVLRWHGDPTHETRLIALVGKGVTFDSGGISIKPGLGMEDMKWDMSGASVVACVILALAARKARVNIVGVVGMVENMPSGTAQRPGDILTSASGKTVEIINTDAEGRLVLADVLWYVQKYFNPSIIIDLATLTGAIVVALGTHYAGLFTNHDLLAKQLITSGQAVGEQLWRMPLDTEYNQQIKSNAADIKNTGDREAGAITAAQFLRHFVYQEAPWAHLDIAGVTWIKYDTPLVPKGATAFGVRLLEHFITNFQEDNEEGT